MFSDQSASELYAVGLHALDSFEPVLLPSAVALAAIPRAIQSVVARTVGSSTRHLLASLCPPRAKAGRDRLTRAVASTAARNHMAPPRLSGRPYIKFADLPVALRQQPSAVKPKRD